MSNFSISFSHPWLLFLFIPAAVILLVAILRVPKKYRNTRNRVVSVVLEAIVMLCVILVLSGMTFVYTTANTENEVLLLVDVTESMNASAETRDDYVESVIYEAENNDCKVGIVTFGFTQVYAAPLSTDYDKVYSQYKNAQLPDTSATDLASALQYTAKLFTSPETAKIVIISDGKETDQSAVSTLTAITSQGTTVESVYVPTMYEGNDIQIVSVDEPDYHVQVGDFFDITLNIQSSCETTTSVTINVTDNGEDVELYDGDDLVDDGQWDIAQGTNTITFRCKVFNKYLNAIRINITGVDDEILTQNNSYCIYIYIDNYNKVLIFQRNDDESYELEQTLLNKDGGETEDGELPYEIVKVTLSEDVYEDDYVDPPLTVDELRQFDLVILNNVSNADMYSAYLEYLKSIGREGDFYSYFFTTSGNAKSGGGLLPQLLYSYVYTYGGGLLTVGGVSDEVDENGNPVANMYKRSDMYGTVLQQMLPVTAINYTEPTGIVIIIDTSGSMGKGEGSRLWYAIMGVLQSLDLLSVRDYLGVIEFSSTPHIIVDMESLMYASNIRTALNNLLENPQSQGTVLAPSLSNAITMLEGGSSLFERKHIIVVSDGDMADFDDCQTYAKQCNDEGISLTAVVVGDESDGYSNMETLCKLANGDEAVIEDERYLFDCSSEAKVAESIYKDIQSTVWEEVNYETFQVLVDSSYIFSSLLTGLFAEKGDGTTDRDHLDAYITRFYGTTIKSGASLILTGDYSIPIYAQWSYGEGMVGSYMGDLHHFDSGGDDWILLDTDSGGQFIINVVDNLMPTEDIRPNGITVNLNEDNYTNRLNVYADVGDGYVVAEVYSCDGENDGERILNLNEVTTGDTDEMDAYVTVAMDAANNYSRANFVIKTPGVYRIEITLYDSDGNIVYNDLGTPSTATIYKRFSYSEEYDNFNAQDGLDLMNSLSSSGSAITDAEELDLIFSGFVTRLEKSSDPTLALIIIALVLFLLDIAVRKFKWKWIHEIVRDRRIKKEKEKG